jgi:hypothetical protein
MSDDQVRAQARQAALEALDARNLGRALAWAAYYLGLGFDPGKLEAHNQLIEEGQRLVDAQDADGLRDWIAALD